MSGEYRTGNAGKKSGSPARPTFSPAREAVAGTAGFGTAEMADGDFRQRLFLASPSRL